MLKIIILEYQKLTDDVPAQMTNQGVDEADSATSKGEHSTHIMLCEVIITKSCSNTGKCIQLQIWVDNRAGSQTVGSLFRGKGV